jgi:HlyD family secretion protein
MQSPGYDPWRSIRKLQLLGYAAIFLFFGSVGTWATVGHLRGAVIASGSLVVESNVKKVQHPTGGIVKDILVAEGDDVKEGQILIRLDDTVTRATLGIVQSQLDELLAREARLEAERDDASRIIFPDELVGRQDNVHVKSAMGGEEKLFESRRNERLGKTSQLQARIVQSREESRGLEAQQDAKEKEIKLILQELSGVRDLFTKSLVSVNRLMQLERDQTRLEGERGQIIAEKARVQGRIHELELQIIQVDQDFRTELLKDMRDTQGKIAELREKYIAAKDQLSHMDIRAPQSGFVYELSAHTVGGVVSPGSTIMEIVPEGEHLLVEAKVPPQDVDQLTLGGSAAVEILAGDRRTMPELAGRVVFISPDSIREPSAGGQPQAPYYVVRIALPKAEIDRLGDFKLLPGMTAEAFIQTSDRTPLQYLLKPLREQIVRTFRER